MTYIQPSINGLKAHRLLTTFDVFIYKENQMSVLDLSSNYHYYFLSLLA